MIYFQCVLMSAQLIFFFFFFLLRLNVPVNNFSVMSGWSQLFLGLISTLFSVGQKHCVNFTSLDDRNKFIWLLTTTDKYIISALSDFIFEAFQIHESL